jgi:hypothetical protein
MPEPELSARRLLTQHWPRSAAFFERAAQELAAPGLGFRGLFASVPRRIGPAADTRPGVVPELPAARPHWRLTEYARLWLIVSALPSVAEAAQPGFVLQLFEAGELGEQVSILRVLPALPDPARFVEVGLQACRTNAKDVFEAIVCDNPFLADHFEPLNFNQAVMKAIFMEVPLARVEQLERRITPELSRMAAGYASERRAAGRAVPRDADYLSQYRG